MQGPQFCLLRDAKALKGTWTQCTESYVSATPMSYQLTPWSPWPTVVCNCCKSRGEEWYWLRPHAQPWPGRWLEIERCDRSPTDLEGRRMGAATHLTYETFCMQVYTVYLSLFDRLYHDMQKRFLFSPCSSTSEKKLVCCFFVWASVRVFCLQNPSVFTGIDGLLARRNSHLLEMLYCTYLHDACAGLYHRLFFVSPA